MSEQRLTSIETRLTSVETKVDELDVKVEALSVKVEALDVKVEALSVKVDTKFQQIDAKFEEVDARFDRVDAKIDDLGHQMRVLHEDTIDKIRALAPDFGPVRREFAAADAKLREEIDQRLVPLEALARTRGTSSPS